MVLFKFETYIDGSFPALVIRIGNLSGCIYSRYSLAELIIILTMGVGSGGGGGWGTPPCPEIGGGRPPITETISVGFFFLDA